MARKVENDNVMGLRVGDILSSCWGYEAEIYDFYEVVGVSKTMVRLRELRKMAFEGSKFPMYYGHMVAPLMEGEYRFTEGKAFSRKPFNFSSDMNPRRTGVAINSYEYAYPWDGRPCDEYNAH